MTPVYRLAFFLGAAFFLAAGFFAPFLPLKIVSQPDEYFFVEPACVTVTEAILS
jgi:hypothetical protein